MKSSVMKKLFFTVGILFLFVILLVYALSFVQADATEQVSCPTIEVLSENINTDIIPYDVNGDGMTDVRDVTALQMYLANFEIDVKEENLDINGDGEIDIIDATELQIILSRNSLESEDRPIITWIDDDTKGNIVEAKQLADSLDIKCTFGYVVTNLDDEILPLLNEYQNEGFHITTHSYSHSAFWKKSSMDIEKIEEDLSLSLTDEKTADFIDKDCLVIPYGNNSEELVPVFEKYCRCAVLSGGNCGRNDFSESRYAINRLFIQPEEISGKSLDTYKRIIDTAVENGDWLVFGTHSSISSEWDYDLVYEVMSYAKSKHLLRQWI